jgi:hypothetical protein
MGSLAVDATGVARRGKKSVGNPRSLLFPAGDPAIDGVVLFFLFSRLAAP